HQRIALSSARSMQNWTVYDSSLDFVPDEYCAMQSPSLSCSDNTSNPPSYFAIGCGSESTIKTSQSVIFLHAVGEIDYFATNFLILNSYNFLTGQLNRNRKDRKSVV